ncbi:hypothetical protein ACS0PU_005061 [Formica fusca]
MSRATRDLVAAFRKIRVIARGLAPIALLSRRPPSRIFRNYSYLDFLRPSLTLSSDAVTVTKTANRQRKSAANTILKAAVIEDATSKASKEELLARTRRC